MRTEYGQSVPGKVGLVGRCPVGPESILMLLVIISTTSSIATGYKPLITRSLPQVVLPNSVLLDCIDLLENNSESLQLSGSDI